MFDKVGTMTREEELAEQAGDGLLGGQVVSATREITVARVAAALRQYGDERAAGVQHWTEKLPTDDGYYWWRASARHRGVVLCVCRGAVFDCGSEHLLRPISEQGGEWFGPLVEPSGEAVG
jgi:hypothetical protein